MALAVRSRKSSPFGDSFDCGAAPIGTWVGGDRDGNPFVTPEITVATARRASHVILGRYGVALDDLTRRLSLSAAIAPPTPALVKSLDHDQKLLPLIWKKNRKRNADEPLRLKLSFMAARIEATGRSWRRATAGRAKKGRGVSVRETFGGSRSRSGLPSRILRRSRRVALPPTALLGRARARLPRLHDGRCAITRRSTRRRSKSCVGRRRDADGERLRSALLRKRAPKRKTRKLSDETRR